MTVSYTQGDDSQIILKEYKTVWFYQATKLSRCSSTGVNFATDLIL